ncbi:Alcohol-forming fatty acyl-CoA reductase-like protein [Drosera capensis]
MECGKSSLELLEDKVILVTGGAGFLAKIFVEKILRSQPKVKKFYLLMRAADEKAAALRLQNEVIGKDLFKVLKHKMGAKFSSFISEKVTVVAGDITFDDLGIKDPDLREEMLRDIDVIINLAANTNFDERYDTSLKLNTYGARYVMEFAKKCTKIKVLVQVSTAYVSGEREGLILEDPYYLGDTLNGAKGLHIEEEKRLVEQRLNDLVAMGSTDEEIKLAMKDMGIEGYLLTVHVCVPNHICLHRFRWESIGTDDIVIATEPTNIIHNAVNRKASCCSSVCLTSCGQAVEIELHIGTNPFVSASVCAARKYGWPNVYVFTKALGEMLMLDLKDDLPLVIIRPTIVTSTYKEPFPGWVEGIRTIDSLADGYGKGKLTCFVGDPTSVVDVIPADMVANAMIVAMVAHANQWTTKTPIYQVGSSVRNPIRFTLFHEVGHDYFTKHPWIDKEGKPVVVGMVKVLGSMASFRRYISIYYILPLKGLELANTALCQFFQGTCTNLNRKINFILRLIDIYRPYLFFKGIYDDMNTHKLRIAAAESGMETNIFYFDPKVMNWADYFMYTHFPGIVRYIFK